MKYITTLILLALTQLALAMDPMPPGPHTKTLYLPILATNVQPGETVLIDTPIIPFDGTTVWTDVKSCMNTQGPTELTHARFHIQDTQTGQFYYLDLRKSWTGDECSGLSNWSNPIHIQHPLKFRFRCTNFGTTEINCRGYVLLYAK